MVGIPGKSKGCHTCRRRKIRCDLQKPDCARCIQSGRECEGYVRGAVFLNRTVKGWEKRERLEEVQPRKKSSSSPQSVGNIKNEPSPSTSQRGSQSPPIQPSAVSQPPIENPDLRKYIFQNLFLESYLPKSPKAGSGLAGAWLFEAIRLNRRNTSLEYSLHALCLTRVGRILGHQDLIKRGTAAYGFALRALHRALENSKLAAKDETLATCLILSIYELYESTSNSTSAHEEHNNGIERLVQFRGHRQNDTPLGKALFKNICYASMIKSLQYRKTSRLKNLVDKAEWWDMQGLLFAKGHSLGALLEDLDKYKNSTDHSLSASAAYLKRCYAMDLDFASWYNNLAEESPSPILWRSGDEPQIQFANINLALVMLDYWALRLILTTTIDLICGQVPKEVPSSVADFVAQLKAVHGSERQVELATNIMDSMPFCMKDEHGVSSSQKCLFSGRVALFALRRHSSEKLSDYEKTFSDLQSKKGLRFAQDIDKKEMTGWTPHIGKERR
ncbi:hypothetical protein B0O99DRAFT_249659 [Bisporella sp. PMI_857]|nr:hypothetical protein B0O99DRAFT_249659 [Bisporella sp. PMI_857]